MCRLHVPGVSTGPAQPQPYFPHPAVVQVDQPARHAQQHDAAAIVPAQAALRPAAVLRHVAADGAAEVAARHVLRPALSVSSTHTFAPTQGLPQR